MEFWSTRDLMPMLGYSTWRQFSEAIERAKDVCKISNKSIEIHFLSAPAKSSGGRKKEEKQLGSNRRNIFLDNNKK